MEPSTIAEIVAVSLVIFAVYHAATIIERRRSYEREFNLRREIRKLNDKIEMDKTAGRGSRKMPSSTHDFVKPSSRSSASTDHGFAGYSRHSSASTNHGFASGVSVGSSFSGGSSSCSSDSGSSSSSDSGSCM